jgi:hypothetical protein
MSRGRSLKGKMEGETEILTREECLQILSEMARSGSVTAAATLERVLRPGDPPDAIDDALDRLLRDAE